MSFFNKIKSVVQTEGARGIRQVLQKEGTKRFAQDLSAHLAVDSLAFCETRRYGLPALVSTVAVDPVQGLLACGTFKGTIAVSGSSELTGYLELEEAVSVKMMAFQPGAPVLIVIDSKNAITVFDLIKRQRLFVRNARNVVTCMELLAGSNWLFHGLKDGTIDVFDVYRGQAVPYKIPNLLPEGRKHSLVISIKTHPTDNNQLLIAYNTGIALWNLKLKSVIRAFFYEIPPGAMGGITAGEGGFGINESRYPHVTVIAWRPDGQGFVSGYEDGCFVFWDIRQERPLLARTIHELNVNVPGTRPVFERDSAQFVPIYQLMWCLNENRDDTTLIVAGGTGSIDMYGLHLFEYPAKADYRSPRRHHTLTLDSDLLDFVVLPRDSPWLNGALDPVSILVLTNRGGIRSFSFDASHTPQTVPATLSFVEPKLVMAKMYGQIPHDLYSRLVRGNDWDRVSSAMPRIPLHGIRLAPIDVSRISHDILVTAHADCSIRFWDGATLKPLHHLTLELGSLFFKNQTMIMALEYSVQSELLTVGFSNGNWIYGRLSLQSGLSRNTSAIATVHNEHIDKALASNFGETLDLGHREDLSRTSARNSLELFQGRAPSQPPLPQRPPQATAPRMEVVSPLDNAKNAALQPPTQPEDPIKTNEGPVQAPERSDTLSPASEDLDYLTPVSPDESIRELSPTGLRPSPPLLDRTPSPSLPPRPTIMEASFPNNSDFSPVFKASMHLGRINHIAVSDCGLVAVSDEFYALSITDTRSGSILHVEDLKVVTLDREKPANAHENHNHNQKHHHDTDSQPRDSRAESGQADPQSFQRVGVVISSLQFVVSTTSDQDKTPSLLLVAGSTNGIYMIFAISSAEDSESDAQPHPGQRHERRARKVETFQTKEQYASVHTSIINVLSSSENATANAAAVRSTSSISSVMTTATSSTSSSMASQPQHHKQQHSRQQSGSHEPLPNSMLAPAAPSPQFSPQRRSEDGVGLGRYPPLSDASSVERRSSESSRPTIYSTWKDAQGKVMSMAQQRLNYLVCVSEYGIRLHMNCTSRRIHKIDLTLPTEHSGQGLAAKTGKIMAANVVYHEGACCILCLTESGRILLFSVPKLELIPLPVPNGELFLPILLEPERLRESVILPEGRIFVPILKFEFRMYSLWGHDRWIQTPQGMVQERSVETSSYIQLYDHGIHIPPRPTNAAQHATRGWFGMSYAVEEAPSQEDLDQLLGGDNYTPVNPILKRAGVQGPAGTTPIATTPREAATGMRGMMNETLQSLDERGQRLKQLGDKTADMSAAGDSFLAAARELNARNANKKWYEF
ncbi:hypothetical protein BGZ99_008919 [Dissophora globulifera]|uniref:V-SNARE coiled-coil homology domain-containing protein n=1 Tax=Dissophora globulifera TaxID=979702 RepID=A0A9P6R5Y4_9FUNG|nr:hypothetical protein BGZ99_008919 [Dissophora globulifera]